MDQAIDLNDVERVGIGSRRGTRRALLERVVDGRVGLAAENSFGLELEHVKLLPKGGRRISSSSAAAARAWRRARTRLVAAKRQGERVVRNSGLGTR